jgi:hypothetical protein
VKSELEATVAPFNIRLAKLLDNTPHRKMQALVETSLLLDKTGRLQAWDRKKAVNIDSYQLFYGAAKHQNGDDTNHYGFVMIYFLCRKVKKHIFPFCD